VAYGSVVDETRLKNTVLLSRWVRNLVSGCLVQDGRELMGRVPDRQQSTREADQVWGSWLHTAATPSERGAPSFILD
jgi:hypothetical protein